MDYCDCGQQAAGRCVGCAQPVCRGCSGTVHAAKTALTARLGLDRRPAVLCRTCERRELADLRTATRERVHAAVRAAAGTGDPVRARLLALGSHLASGGSSGGAETGHWPTFDELRAPAGLVEADAYREILALIRAEDVVLRTGLIRVYVDARVKHLTGIRRDAHDLGSVEGVIMPVQLTSGDWAVTVRVAVRADGSLLTAPAPVAADLYRVRITDGTALEPFPIPMDKYPWEVVKSSDMRRRLAALRAQLDHIEQAPPGTDEFGAMVREHPEVDVRYAEEQMFRALWRSIDEECTPVPKL